MPRHERAQKSCSSVRRNLRLHKRGIPGNGHARGRTVYRDDSLSQKSLKSRFGSLAVYPARLPFDTLSVLTGCQNVSGLQARRAELPTDPQGQSSAPRAIRDSRLRGIVSNSCIPLVEVTKTPDAVSDVFWRTGVVRAARLSARGAGDKLVSGVDPSAMAARHRDERTVFLELAMADDAGSVASHPARKMHWRLS
jgi:hypothetical protein